MWAAPEYFESSFLIGRPAKRRLCGSQVRDFIVAYSTAGPPPIIRLITFIDLRLLMSPPLGMCWKWPVLSSFDICQQGSFRGPYPHQVV